LDANSKRVLFQIFMNLIKKGCVIKNYQQRLKSKLFMFENDITLLLISCISLLKHKVRTTKQCIRFFLLTPKAICDDKLTLEQRQCPPNFASTQNTSCHETLQVLMVWIHNDFMLNFFKQMTPFLKGIHNGYINFLS
jgi:hypothetical protein